jgi:hypothetical protein
MASWTWAAASRRGTSHERTGTNRQDAFRVIVGNDRRTLIAVTCDGAGSVSHGGEGANIAARTFSNCAKAALGSKGRQPDDATIWGWIDLARDRIAAVAERLGLTPRDFATTVVMAISNGRSTLVVHIGDGAVVGRDKRSGEWESLSWPAHGEYASTTFFLTDDRDVRAQITRLDKPIDRLAIFTDGVERLALDFAIGKPHTPFFAGVSEPVARSVSKGCDTPLSKKLGDYLSSAAVNERTDDDKTLILASFS